MRAWFSDKTDEVRTLTACSARGGTCPDWGCYVVTKPLAFTMLGFIVGQINVFFWNCLITILFYLVVIQYCIKWFYLSLLVYHKPISVSKALISIHQHIVISIHFWVRSRSVFKISMFGCIHYVDFLYRTCHLGLCRCIKTG